MKETDYAYAVAYIRTLENKMLTRSDYEALMRAASCEEAMRFLLGKGYGNKKESSDPEVLLREELRFTWDEIRNACPKDAPVEIFLYQNDFFNLKTIVKAVFSGAGYEHLILEPYTLSPEVIRRAVAGGKPEILPDIFKKPAAQAYELFAREGDVQLAEVALDKALYELLRKTAERAENAFLSGWVDLNVSIMNMKIALRGMYGGKDRAFLRGSMLESVRINADYLADAAMRGAPAVLQVFAQSGFGLAAEAAITSMSAFEKWCDNELIGYVRQARYMTFGFEPILAFLVIKQYELQALRIILSGLRVGIPAEALRERMRDLYV